MNCPSCGKDTFVYDMQTCLNQQYAAEAKIWGEAIEAAKAIARVSAKQLGLIRIEESWSMNELDALHTPASRAAIEGKK